MIIATVPWILSVRHPDPGLDRLHWQCGPQLAEFHFHSNHSRSKSSVSAGVSQLSELFLLFLRLAAANCPRQLFHSRVQVRDLRLGMQFLPSVWARLCRCVCAVDSSAVRVDRWRADHRGQDECRPVPFRQCVHDRLLWLQD